MVIVVIHALASAFLYLRDRFFVGHTSPRLNRNSSNDSDSDAAAATRGCFQWRYGCRDGGKRDAFLSILDATNLTELREAIHLSVRQCLPRVSQVHVFLKNSDTEQIEADGFVLPTHGVIRDAFHQSKLHMCSIPPDPDPVLEILHLHSSDPHKVILLPISRPNHANIGIIVACFKSDCLSIDEEKCLSVLVKQSSVTYYAIQQPHLDTISDSSRLESLISLCGDLHDQDAATLELKVIRYLREQTHAESGFLLLVVPETLELISQVVGNTILPEEVRFPGLWSCFAQALETKMPMFLEHIPLDRRAEVEKIVEMNVRSFLCVPVARKGSEDLIALACLVNKTQGQRFTDADIGIVRQCFKYTATVLTSTLAFQNERKLKNQTQALLHVARKLFTRLGESMSVDNKETQKIKERYLAIIRYVFCFRIRHLIFSAEEQDHIAILPRHSPSQFKSGHRRHTLRKLTPKEGSRHQVSSSNLEAKQIKKPAPSDSALSQPAQADGTEKAKKKTVKISIIEEETPAKQDKDEDKGSAPPPVVKDKKQSSSLVTSGQWLEDLDEESARRRLEDRRKRAFSVSYFRMYDPTCQEAESESEESSDEEEKEEDASPQSPVQDETDAHSQVKVIETQSQDTDAGVSSFFRPFSAPASFGFLQKKKGSEEILSRSKSQPSVEALFPPLSILSTTVKIEKPAVSFGSVLSLPASIDNKMALSGSSLLVPCESSSRRATKSIRRKSWRDSLSQPHTPFSQVRKLPMERFCLPDGTLCPYITFLLHNAPGDGFYSDGDFLYDLTKLLREIMQEARNLTDAERCSVFLLDQDSDELVATVFDGITTNNKEVQSEIRLPKTQGIAGHVATTGTLLNIKDAYSHPLFYRGIDDSTGFRTRNILCFPIKDEEGVVLGVAQLCNKKTGTYFTTFDEDIASAFAVYCCISISHSLMYKKVIDIQYRNSLANELMMFHMKCLIYKKLQDTQHRHMLANELMKFHMQQIPAEEVQELAVQGMPDVHVFHKDFDAFPYPPRTLAESRTHLACQAMFEDLGFITRWRLKSDTLARFLLMVKKGYRNPPYHNWMHAFSVAHFGYLCIKNLKLSNYLDDIEIFALFVSCLCHDIDHRGTTNSFQVKSQSVLAALYSSEGSVMERHHLAQSMCILNTEGSNIFENLNSREYQQVLDLMRDIILATDVAHHLRIFGSLEEMAKNGYNKNDPKCHNLLLCLLMTASDLSDQTKSWDNTKHIAVLIYQEFFSQGDLEKALGESPLEMMDRERACVPDLQISFLDNIAMPVYKVLAEIFPESKSVEECVEKNRKHWVHKAQMLKLHNNSAQTMSVLEIIALGEEDAAEREEKMDTNQQNGR